MEVRDWLRISPYRSRFREMHTQATYSPAMVCLGRLALVGCPAGFRGTSRSNNWFSELSNGKSWPSYARRHLTSAVWSMTLAAGGTTNAIPCICSFGKIAFERAILKTAVIHRNGPRPGFAQAQRTQRAAKKINDLTRFFATGINHPKGE
jgi:hypothetical protein